MAEQIYKNFTETDFEQIKESLKDHLKSQDTFKDYNFDGSAINVLLNLLAYNTQYNAYYLNMMASEKFLNSAQKRESVVGSANNIGYIPRSPKSSVTYLSFDIVPNTGYNDAITIPKDTKFTTQIDGTTYNFLTTESLTLAKNSISGLYEVRELEAKEGRKFTHKFLYDGSTKYFKLPNGSIDTSRIVVKVKPNQYSTDENSREYSYYNSILNLDSESEVYFIQEVENKKYEIYFGDGILGKALSPNNQIVVEYYVTSGVLPNGATTFTLADEFTGLESISNLTATRASFGADIESTDSVRNSAKISRQAQDRTVIPSDYISVVRALIPTLTSLSVWGGEDATPKVYGKVFLSGIKENFLNLTPLEKRQALSKLSNEYSVLGITPEFVDAKLFNLEINSLIDIDIRSQKSQQQFRADITSKIISDLIPQLQKFQTNIYESRVEEVINSVDKYILSNKTYFRQYAALNEQIQTRRIGGIYYPVGIKQNSIESNDFTYNNVVSRLIDNGESVDLVSIDGSLVKSNVFTINHSTGFIKENYTGLLYDLGQSGCILYARPLANDIKLLTNFILRLNQSDIKITFNE